GDRAPCVGRRDGGWLVATSPPPAPLHRRRRATCNPAAYSCLARPCEAGDHLPLSCFPCPRGPATTLAVALVERRPERAPTVAGDHAHASASRLVGRCSQPSDLRPHRPRARRRHPRRRAVGRGETGGRPRPERRAHPGRRGHPPLPGGARNARNRLLAT